MRSSTARASATIRYIATRSASASPTEAARGLTGLLPPGLGDRHRVLRGSAGGPVETGPADTRGGPAR